MDAVQRRHARRTNFYWFFFSLFLLCTVGGLAFITIPNILSSEVFFDQTPTTPQALPGAESPPEFLSQNTLDLLHKSAKIIAAIIATISPIITGISLIYLWRRRRRLRLARKMARLHRRD